MRGAPPDISSPVVGGGVAAASGSVGGVAASGGAVAATGGAVAPGALLAVPFNNAN